MHLKYTGELKEEEEEEEKEEEEEEEMEEGQEKQEKVEEVVMCRWVMSGWHTTSNYGPAFSLNSRKQTKITWSRVNFIQNESLLFLMGNNRQSTAQRIQKHPKDLFDERMMNLFLHNASQIKTQVSNKRSIETHGKRPKFLQEHLIRSQIIYLNW